MKLCPINKKQLLTVLNLKGVFPSETHTFTLVNAFDTMWECLEQAYVEARDYTTDLLTELRSDATTLIIKSNVVIAGELGPAAGSKDKSEKVRPKRPKFHLLQ